MLDIKIINGKIIDVENKRIVEGDIGIKDGKITDIGSVPDEGKVEIDAGGKLCISWIY